MDKLKNIFITATVGLLVLTSLISCHKYPEDSFISLRKPEYRLMGGSQKNSIGRWRFVSYKINGTEHSQDFDSFLSKSPNFTTLTRLSILFYRDYDLIFRVENLGETDGGFEITNNKKVIRFTGGTNSPDTISNLFKLNVLKFDPNKHFAEWTIKELYKDNFHIQNNNTDIYFKKQ